MIRRVDTWTVLKFSVLFYFSLALVLLVAAIVLFVVAGATGLRHGVEKFIGDLIASDHFRLRGGQILLGSGLSGAVLVVLGTGANVLTALLYNLISDMVGGIEVSVLEDAVEPLPPAPRPLPAELGVGSGAGARWQTRPPGL